MTVEYRLVAPQVWHPLVRDWFTALGDDERRFAASILTGLHDRHVGITPRLSASLSRALITTQPTAPWDAAFDRLHRANESDGDLPLIPERAADFAVFDLAAPLVARACESIETCYLFAEDATDAPVKSDAYAEYDEALFQAVQHIVRQETDDMLPHRFWQERALRLATTSSFAPGPDFPFLDTAIFFALQPAMRPRREDAFNLFTPHPQRLRDERRESAGADGLMLTRREEDIQRMHLSEYIYPEAIRLDRVINTGYTIVKPPPQPVRQRDMLLITLSYGDTADTFLKTCFADFALYVSRIVNQVGDSQIRWIEGDKFGRVRSQYMLLRNLSQRIPVEIPAGDVHKYRRLFLESAGWLPEYLDAGAPMVDPPNTETASVAEWLRDVWRQHTDPLQTPPDAPGIRLDDYQFIYLMLFLPASIYTNDPMQIQRLYDLFSSSVDGVCLTWVPDDPRDMGNWTIEGSAGRWMPSTEIVQLERLAGGLIDAWLDAIVYEMRHV